MPMALRMIVKMKLTTLAVKLKELEYPAFNDVGCVEDDGDASLGVVLRAGAGGGAGAGADITCCASARVSGDSQQLKEPRSATESFPRVESQLWVVAETVGGPGTLGVFSLDT